MSDAARHAQAIFQETIELSSPDAREKFLAQRCADDPELRQRVRQLLEAHEEAGDFLKIGAPLSPEVEAQFARLKPEESGERIGHYKLLQQIGEGCFTIFGSKSKQLVT